MKSLSKELRICKNNINKLEKYSYEYSAKNKDKNSKDGYELVQKCLFFCKSIAELSRKSGVSMATLRKILYGEGKTNCSCSTKNRLEFFAKTLK